MRKNIARTIHRLLRQLRLRGGQRFFVLLYRNLRNLHWHRYYGKRIEYRTHASHIHSHVQSWNAIVIQHVGWWISALCIWKPIGVLLWHRNIMGILNIWQWRSGINHILQLIVYGHMCCQSLREIHIQTRHINIAQIQIRSHTCRHYVHRFYIRY